MGLANGVEDLTIGLASIFKEVGMQSSFLDEN